MSSRETIQKLKVEITFLRRQDGSFNPQDVVDWARENPKSILHKCFEWDNKIAGEEYRRLQARQLIERHALKVSQSGEETTIEVISVPSLRKGGEGSYLDRNDVAAKEEYRIEVLEEIKAKLRSMRDKYEPITPELKSVWGAVRKYC